MPVISPLCGRALRGLVLFMFITAMLISGTTITANAKTNAYQEITSRILNLFPAFAGKVQDVQGSTVVIQAAPGSPVASGSYLMIKKETAKGATQSVIVRVTGVSGQEIRAERIGKQEIKKGDPVTGWPRPLPVALVPMSREALGVLMEYSPANGDLAPIRNEDVLATMIENHYADFSTAEKMDLSVLGSALKTPLILEVKILSGFGENILQMAPYAVETGAGLDTFSVLLSSRSTAMAEARPLPAPVPAETTAAAPHQQGVDILSADRPETEEAAAPLALPMTAAGSAVQPAMPKLPPLQGFNDPAHWVRILKLDQRIMSMAAGNFTGDSNRALAIGVPGKIQIYTLRQEMLRVSQRLEDQDLSTLFWLEAYDLNGDGVDEIIVNTDEGVLVITHQQGSLRIVHRRKGLFIRRTGSELYAQTLSGLQLGGGPVHAVRWNNNDWQEGEELKGPGSENLFALVEASSESGLYLSADHHLMKAETPVSSETCGQTDAPALIAVDYPLFARGIAVSGGALCLKNRDTGWPQVGKMKYTGGGSALFLPIEGEASLSPSFRGYLADIALDDLDGDGEGEILVLQIIKGISGGAYVLMY
ncbi:MAG: hypothetical protein AABY87_10515 [bacterium]